LTFHNTTFSYTRVYEIANVFVGSETDKLFVLGAEAKTNGEIDVTFSAPAEDGDYIEVFEENNPSMWKDPKSVQTVVLKKGEMKSQLMVKRDGGSIENKYEVRYFKKNSKLGTTYIPFAISKPFNI
ncbi:hypothetical protein EIN_139200, partial [Entamoeba invadens IP1]